MEIKWIGNTSFLIKTSFGRRILLDPLQITPYIQNYDLNLDIITLSHVHNLENLNFSQEEKTKILSSVCNFENDYLKIESFKTYRDNICGHKRGENLIFNISLENIRICHLGSLGHILDKDLIGKIYGCDILFIPIGGHFCLDGKSASKLSKAINPKIIVPMSFKISDDSNFLEGPYKFLANMKNVISLNSDTFYLDDFKDLNNSTVLLLNKIKNC